MNITDEQGEFKKPEIIQSGNVNLIPRDKDYLDLIFDYQTAVGLLEHCNLFLFGDNKCYKLEDFKIVLQEFLNQNK
jgi:hypothetical protein